MADDEWVSLCCCGCVLGAYYLAVGVWAATSLPGADEASALLAICHSSNDMNSTHALRAMQASVHSCGESTGTLGTWLVTAGVLSVVHPLICLGCALAVGIASMAKGAGVVACGVYFVRFFVECHSTEMQGTCLNDEFGTRALMLCTAIALAVDLLGMCALIAAAAGTGCKMGEPFLEGSYRP